MLIKRGNRSVLPCEPLSAQLDRYASRAAQPRTTAWSATKPLTGIAHTWDERWVERARKVDP